MGLFARKSEAPGTESVAAEAEAELRRAAEALGAPGPPPAPEPAPPPAWADLSQPDGEPLAAPARRRVRKSPPAGTRR